MTRVPRRAEMVGMALGKRKDATQQPLFVLTAELPSLRPNPFYEAVNQMLAEHDFDR